MEITIKLILNYNNEVIVMDIKTAKEITDEIEQTRIEINKVKALIANADFRLSQSEDQMWINTKKDQELKLEQLNKKLELLYEKFSLLKNVLSDFYWGLELELLGFVLAKTENINHVANFLHDEFELKKSIDQTELAIEKYYALLDREKDNKDASAVINSALNYFKADMKSHYWGEERLKQIEDSHTIKDANYFRI